MIDEKNLIARYQSGTNVRQLSEEFDIALQTVYNVLQRNGVSRRADTMAEDLVKLIDACSVGVPVAIAARRLGISERTASRALRKYRADGGQIILPKGRPSRDRTTSSTKEVPRDYVMTKTDAALGVGFPFPTMLSADRIDSEFKHLCLFEGRLDENNAIRPKSPLGLKICGPFFPNRYRARSRYRKSAFGAWHNAKDLKRAIEFQIKHGHPTTPPRVLRAIMVKCRTPTIFRPAVAKFICDRYCPRGGCVWDPCSGFGGRLLGITAAGARYIGTDVDAETVDGNRRLAAALGVEAEVHLESAVVFKPPAVDLVFTSPPYFDRERYSTASDETWKNRPTVDLWFDNFIKPIFINAREALGNGRHLVINIADIRENGENIPLAQKTIDAAIAVGFTHTETLRMPLAAINRTDPFEPVLVFRKL